MHSRCGSIEEAQEVFVMMLERDMDGPLQHPNPGMLLDPGKSPVRDRVFFAKLSNLGKGRQEKFVYAATVVVGRCHESVLGIRLQDHWIRVADTCRCRKGDGGRSGQGMGLSCRRCNCDGGEKLRLC